MVSTIYPGQGVPADLRVIDEARSYLRDFAEGVNSGDARTAEERMLSKYSTHRDVRSPRTVVDPRLSAIH